MQENEREKEFKIKVKEIFSSLLTELNILNLANSLKRKDIDKFFETYDCIRIPMNIAVDFISTEKELYGRGAFLYVYLYQTRNVAMRSLLEALFGYYSCAYTLLRQAFESIISGAYFECLAHKKFRECKEIPEITRKGNSTLKGEIKERILKNPEIEKKLERDSIYIFDILDSVNERKNFKGKRKHLLLPPEMVDYLDKWEMFEPIPNPREKWQKIYDRLSKEAHNYPSYTEVGRRIARFPQKDFLEVNVVPQELDEFFAWVKKVMDIGIVIELNILADYIKKKSRIKSKLSDWLSFTEKNLNLEFTPKKIKDLMK